MNLVDTDVFVDFFRGVSKSANYFITNESSITFSAITEGELLAGNVCNEAVEREQVLHVLSRFEKVAADNPVVRVAGDLKRVYGLSLPDAIIAASAIVTKSVLVTRNKADFGRVKGLDIKVPY